MRYSARCWDSTGEAPCLATCFRDKLGACLGVEVPERAFLTMDFHLDWIQLALHLSENPGIEPGSTFRDPGLPDFNKTQEDIDLLVAFEGETTLAKRSPISL